MISAAAVTGPATSPCLMAGERFRRNLRIEPPPARPVGFTAGSTSGLLARELVAPNRLLERLMANGMSEHEAKVAIDAAVRTWLEPGSAGETDPKRLIFSR